MTLCHPVPPPTSPGVLEQSDPADGSEVMALLGEAMAVGAKLSPDEPKWSEEVGWGGSNHGQGEGGVEPWLDWAWLRQEGSSSFGAIFLSFPPACDIMGG